MPNHNVLQQGVVLNMNGGRPMTTFVNANQAQRAMSPRVMINNGQIRLGPQVIQGTRPGAPVSSSGTAIFNEIDKKVFHHNYNYYYYKYLISPIIQNIPLPANMRSGAILFKTENGFQILHAVPSSTGQNMAIPQTAYRFQVPAGNTPTSCTSVVTTQNAATTIRPVPGQQILTLPANMANSLSRSAVITTKAQPHMITTGTPTNIRSVPLSASATQPLTIQTSGSVSGGSSSNSGSSTPSQMSPNTAKKKCKNFLSTLIRLASDQPEQVATNVKNLIQGLIDGIIQPEDFTVQLQRELNSSPQPCLIPFLKKSLPYLRHSLMIHELTIDGVKAPPQGSVLLPGQAMITTASGTQIQQIQISRQTPQSKASALRLVSGGNLAIGQPGTVLATGRPGVAPKAIHKYQKHGAASGASITVTPSNAPLATGTRLSDSIPRTSLSAQKKKEAMSKIKSPAASKDRKDLQKKKEDKDAYSNSLRDDDDINDVAAMGGVNLMEEHQRILATNAEFVGAQIRSCKDEPFLSVNPLQSRINKIASKFGLEEVSSDVIALVSHAAQEKLKTLVEKLGVIAEHRMENLKVMPVY